MIAPFYYKAIVPALSIDKASSWPFPKGTSFASHEAGDMRSRLQCALQGIMIFATPTYRSGGHLLPSYNATAIVLSKINIIAYLQQGRQENHEENGPRSHDTGGLAHV